MNITEIKKDLYKSKVDANFSHYCKGTMYYTVLINDILYQFPISIITETLGNITLSNDLGDTTFSNVIPGRLLIRWIEQAILKGEMINLN